jgi:hypothetical protein
MFKRPFPKCSPNYHQTLKYSVQNISEPELRHRKKGKDDGKCKRKGVRRYREGLVSFRMRYRWKPSLSSLYLIG